MFNAFRRSSFPVFALLGAFLCFSPASLRAQEEGENRNPLDVPLSPAVKALLDDDATPEAEKRKIAIFHGQWERVKDPTLDERAAIALARYELNDPALNDEKSPPLLRARAALYRGEPEKALKLLEKEGAAVAALLRAQALEQMGKEKEAIEVLAPWSKKLGTEGFADAAELTAAAQALAMLADLEGRPSRDFTQAMKLFGRARNELDKLYWPAAIAEAELLMEKDNPEEAIGALLDVLRLNPRCPEAAGMLGQFAAQRFNFDDAGKIAARLRDVNAEHLLAAVIDGHSFLTQKDAAGARTAIEPTLAKYPNHRELLEILAAAEAMAYDEKQMNAVLAHYDKLTGDNPGALITAGSYLSLARQYDLAEKLLREAVKRRDNWAHPRIELGLMLMQAGKEQEALVELRKAAALDPFNRRARNQLKLVEELLGYEHIALDHFVIKYRKGIDEVLARDMEQQLEEMFTAVTGAYEHKPGRKTLIEIMPDEQWFGVRITGLPEIWTIAACTGDVIALTPPREGAKQRGPYDWRRVLQHEYTHTVTLDQTAYRIPHWMTEAAAVAMEPGGRDFQMTQLLAAAYNGDGLFTLDNINWGFIRPRKPTDRPLAYAQAHWMLEYITAKYGHKALLEMFALYRKGVTETKAIVDVTGHSAEEFFSGFREWAGKQVKEWGLAKRDDDGKVTAKLKEKSVDDARLKELLKEFVDHPDLLELAARHAVSRETPGARELVLRYAAARPADPWSHEALYTLAENEGKPEDAIASLHALDRVEQGEGKWAHRLAEIYRKQGAFAPAGKAIERALHREPYNATWRELAAAIAIQGKQFPVAAHQVRALTILEPDRAVHQIRLAAVYDLMGEKAKSKAAAEAARKIDTQAPVEKFLKQD